MDKLREENKILAERLGSLSHDAGVDCNWLREAMNYSHGIQHDLAAELTRHFKGLDQLTVVLVGSLGRLEAANGSDADFIVLFEREGRKTRLDDVRRVMRFITAWFEERHVHVTDAEKIRSEAFLRSGSRTRGKFPDAFPTDLLRKTLGRYEHDISDARTRRIAIMTEGVCLFNAPLFEAVMRDLADEYGLLTCIEESTIPRIFLDDIKAHYAGFYPALRVRLEDATYQGADLSFFKTLLHRRMTHLSTLSAVLIHLSKKSASTDDLLMRCVRGSMLSRCIYLFEIVDKVLPRREGIAGAPASSRVIDIIRHYNVALGAFNRHRQALSSPGSSGQPPLPLPELRHSLSRHLDKIESDFCWLLRRLDDELRGYAADDRGLLAELV